MGKSNKEEDFWQKVRILPGCWPWLGTVNNRGYGVFSYDGGYHMAHRLVMRFIGENLTPKDVVLHSCDNKWCVNPFHLRAGTQAENVADMHAKNRNVIGSMIGNAKLNEEKVRYIRRAVASGEKNMAELAREFGVAYVTVFRAVKRDKWKHVK